MSGRKQDEPRDAAAESRYVCPRCGRKRDALHVQRVRLGGQYICARCADRRFRRTAEQRLLARIQTQRFEGF